MPELSFLADMNISPLTVESLRKEGWDIVRVHEVMDIKSRDEIILDFARADNRVVITEDLDFSKLLALGGHEKPSVINFRIEDATPDVMTHRIKEVVASFEKELKEGVVVSVDETSMRYRFLPIQRE